MNLKTKLVFLALVVLGALFLVWVSTGKNQRREDTQSIAHYVGAPQRPDPRLTPGDVMTTDLALICKVGYSRTARDVERRDHRGVFKDYGLPEPQRGEYEVDHLISLQLGGSNDRKNLWPQSYRTHPYNAHLKDKLENRLRKMVCKGNMSIQEAQHRIATDWISSYNEFYGVPNGAH